MLQRFGSGLGLFVLGGVDGCAGGVLGVFGLPEDGCCGVCSVGMFDPPRCARAISAPADARSAA